MTYTINLWDTPKLSETTKSIVVVGLSCSQVRIAARTRSSRLLPSYTPRSDAH